MPLGAVKLNYLNLLKLHVHIMYAYTRLIILGHTCVSDMFSKDIIFMNCISIMVCFVKCIMFIAHCTLCCSIVLRIEWILFCLIFIYLNHSISRLSGLTIQNTHLAILAKNDPTIGLF